LLQPVVELRTLQAEGTNRCALIRPHYQLLFWMTQPWNSEMDVQRRWLWAVVASYGYVRNYVDISFLQWLLPSLVQNQCLF